MHNIFGCLVNLKGTKHYVIIPTNKYLNKRALKCYIECFNICLYKRDSTLEKGITYYGTPCRCRATEILKSKSVHVTDDVIDVIRT